MVIYEHNSWRAKWARLWKRAAHIFGPHLTVPRAVNVLALEAQRVLRRTRVSGAPYVLFVELSSICNLRCPGCLSFDPSYHSRLLPLEEFRETLDHYAPLLVDLELYGWGEPFLNRSIFEMIRHAKSRNLFVRTSSNFNRFEPGDPERIVRSGLDQLNASLDGTTQETYGKYRVNANLDVALDNLRRLVAAKRRLRSKTPLIEWQFIVSRVNHHQIADVKRLAADVGVDILRLDLPFSLAHINESDDPEAVDRWLADDPLYRQWASAAEADSHACDRVCSYLWSTLQVDSTGQINPCPNRIGSQVQCGAALAVSARAAFNHPILTEGRRLFARRPTAPPSTFGPCRACGEALQPWKSIWPEEANRRPPASA